MRISGKRENYHFFAFQLDKNCSKKVARKAMFNTGLPDFSWYMIPNPEKNVTNEHKMYQMVINIPNVRKIFQMAIKYKNIVQSKALQNLTKLGFLV
jgi:hypothetical protein